MADSFASDKLILGRLVITRVKVIGVVVIIIINIIIVVSAAIINIIFDRCY